MTPEPYGPPQSRWATAAIIVVSWCLMASVLVVAGAVKFFWT